MGVFNNALGMNFTQADTIDNSPFEISSSMGTGGTPPGESYMITETSIFMLTEDGLNLMIVE